MDINKSDHKLIDKLVKKYGRKSVVKKVWSIAGVEEPYTGYLAPYLEEILALADKGVTRAQIADRITPKLLNAADTPDWFKRQYGEYAPEKLTKHIRPMLNLVLVRYGRKVVTHPIHSMGPEIAVLREQGWTFAKIGKKFGRSVTRVRDAYVRELRAAKRRQRFEGLGPVTNNTLVRLIPFSTRTANALENDDIQTVGDLIVKTEAELLRVPNFGRQSLSEVTAFLRAHDKHVGMPYPNRNAEIAARRRAGASYMHLAEEFDITPEKVGQIEAQDQRRRRKLETST